MTVTPKTIIGAIANKVSGIKPVIVTALSTEETIIAGVEGAVIAVVGMNVVETSASNLTFTSGTDNYMTLELAANSGIVKPIGAPIFMTQPGEALKMTASVEISSMLLYIQQDDAYKFKME